MHSINVVGVRISIGAVGKLLLLHVLCLLLLLLLLVRSVLYDRVFDLVALLLQLERGHLMLIASIDAVHVVFF